MSGRGQGEEEAKVGAGVGEQDGGDNDGDVQAVKQRLLSIFRHDGSVGRLKAQLRHQFLRKLQNGTRQAWGETKIDPGTNERGRGGAEPSPIPGVSLDILRGRAQAPTLFQRALNAVVADYLKNSGLDFTYSIFVPESGSEGLHLSEQEIVATLRLDGVVADSGYNGSVACDNSEAAEDACQGGGAAPSVFNASLLGRLLGAAKLHAERRVANMGSKACDKERHSDPFAKALTTTNGPRESNISDKVNNNYNDSEVSRLLTQRLQAVHDRYLDRAHEMRRRGPGSQEDLEARFLNYQRQCDERAKRELDVALKRARQAEADAVRAELEEKHRIELSEVRSRARDELSTATRRLAERESRLMEEARRREAALEAERFDHRQRALAELESQRQRDVNAKQSHAVERRAIRLERQQMEERERSLRAREMALITKETQMQNEAMEAAERFKTEARAILSSRETAVVSSEHELRRRMAKFEAEGGAIMRRAEEADKSRALAVTAQEEKETLQSNLTQAHRDIERLKETVSKLEREGASDRSVARSASEGQAAATAEGTRLREELHQLRRDFSAAREEMERERECHRSRLGEVKTKAAMRERELLSEVETLRERPAEAIERAKEGWRWQESEFRRERHLLRTKAEQAHLERERLARRVEEAAGAEKAVRDENEQLRRLLQHARMALATTATTGAAAAALSNQQQQQQQPVGMGRSPVAGLSGTATVGVRSDPLSLALARTRGAFSSTAVLCAPASGASSMPYPSASGSRRNTTEKVRNRCKVPGTQFSASSSSSAVGAGEVGAADLSIDLHRHRRKVNDLAEEMQELQRTCQQWLDMDANGDVSALRTAQLNRPSRHRKEFAPSSSSSSSSTVPAMARGTVPAPGTTLAPHFSSSNTVSTTMRKTAKGLVGEIATAPHEDEGLADDGDESSVAGALRRLTGPVPSRSPDISLRLSQTSEDGGIGSAGVASRGVSSGGGGSVGVGRVGRLSTAIATANGRTNHLSSPEALAAAAAAAAQARAFSNADIARISMESNTSLASSATTTGITAPGERSHGTLRDSAERDNGVEGVAVDPVDAPAYDAGPNGPKNLANKGQSLTRTGPRNQRSISHGERETHRHVHKDSPNFMRTTAASRARSRPSQTSSPSRSSPSLSSTPSAASAQGGNGLGDLNHKQSSSSSSSTSASSSFSGSSKLESMEKRMAKSPYLKGRGTKGSSSNSPSKTHAKLGSSSSALPKVTASSTETPVVEISSEEAERIADREREAALLRYKEQLARKRREAGYGDASSSLSTKARGGGKEDGVDSSGRSPGKTAMKANIQRTTSKESAKGNARAKNTESAKSTENTTRKEEAERAEKKEEPKRMAVDEKVLQAREKYRQLYKSKGAGAAKADRGNQGDNDGVNSDNADDSTGGGIGGGTAGKEAVLLVAGGGSSSEDGSGGSGLALSTDDEGMLDRSIELDDSSLGL